jgi:acetylornithine/succinyldiaminopimelate/putrescine aminotransferase/predicted amino acid dehydrogenase
MEPNPNSLYATYCRPKLSDLLGSLNLDPVYTRASGAYLYRDHPDGSGEQRVLDLIGGFGTGLFGHNNPELRDFLKARLDEDMPSMAQSSRREEAGRLAARINKLLPGDQKYICHLANTGTEAVEAVLKHAYKVRFDQIRREFESVARQIEEFFQLTDRNDPDIEVPGSERDLGKFRDDLDEHNLAQFELFQNGPVVVALKGAFHGKTASALKITFNKTYRESFEGLSAIKPDFIDPSDIHRLDEVVLDHQIQFLVPKVEDRRIIVETISCSKVIALALEVIQGEGGIRPVPEDVLAALADQRARLDVPIFVDEIQTGCGRTGSFVAYATGPLAALAPDYITLGKALGGGLVKIAAALIREDIYDLDFGILHTSTFAEDELSCAVASQVLDVLERDDAAFMTSVVAKGDMLREGLEGLAEQFPGIIREVRGHGLMIGIEFTELMDRGAFFRFGARQGFLSLVIASYLLHHHGIRLLAPLASLMKGNPGKKRLSVLRIQPAEDITDSDITRTVDALREVCGIIARNNEGVLIGHLIGLEVTQAERADPALIQVTMPPRQRHVAFDARVGFTMHPARIDQIRRFYMPSIEGRADPEVLDAWWQRLARFLEPDVVHTDYIESEGFVVEANFVLLPFLSQYMSEVYVRARDTETSSRLDRIRLQEIQDKVQDAVTVAKELGDDHIPTSVVGLGAYTSIVTDRGRSINDYEVPITTGNAYTTALMTEGILRAAELRGVSLSDAQGAVVGAAGNIGSALAAILCTQLGSLRLIGRTGGDSLERLKRVRLQCLLYLCQKAREQLDASVPIEEVSVGGVGDRILHDIVLPALDSIDEAASGWARAEAWLRDGEGVSPELGSLLEEAIDRDGGSDGNPYITLHDSMEAVADCDVVTIATNSPASRLISPETVKEGAIVSCASVPSNLSRAFTDHLDDYFVFDGGYARLPEGQEIDCAGLPRDGLAHGCFSETLLLGFDGQNGSFARGRLAPEQVEQTLEMAELYGFELGELIMADQEAS